MSEWHRAEDRMPDETGNYIVFAVEGNKYKHVTIALYQKTQKRFVLTGRRTYWKITHWMPFPNLPKEVSE